MFGHTRNSTQIDLMNMTSQSNLPENQSHPHHQQHPSPQLPSKLYRKRFNNKSYKSYFESRSGSGFTGSTTRTNVLKFSMKRKNWYDNGSRETGEAGEEGEAGEAGEAAASYL